MTEQAAPLPPWLRLPQDRDAVTEPASPLIRGAACRTRPDLFDEWSRVLDFPHHFGRNWDALADTLLELAWPEIAHPGPGVSHPLTIVVDDAEQLLADEPIEQLAVLLSVLDNAASGQPLASEDPWQASAPHLLLCLQAAPGTEAEMLTRLRTAWSTTRR